MKQAIHVYNTLGKSRELLTPLKDNQITVYHCGPTVYWTQHIGNMRAAFFGDIVNRTLAYAGYDVTFVRNYTDVGHLSGDNQGDADSGEDRMSKAAKRERANPEDIASKYQIMFDTDLERLNIITPDYRPRATRYIQAMIELVQDLLDKGYAYQTDLAIYFDTSLKDDYYKLSGQQKDMLSAGAGAGDVADSGKKNPADFALWFFKTGAHAQALQTWKNPFSEVEGFPGWHIECSAMIRELLGVTIDIHLGGIEHIPIHHTNEIAQSESAHSAPLARYWLHNEHLDVDGAKMSKSEGTAYSVQELVDAGYSPLDLRYFFLQAHYRSKQNFTYEALDAARTARMRLHERIYAMPEGGSVDESFKAKFAQILFDDFNTSGALALVSEVLKSNMSEQDKKATILDFDSIFGLKLATSPQEEVLEISNEVQGILDARKDARETKNWQESDRLRDALDELGYIVHDTSEGHQKLSLK